MFPKQLAFRLCLSIFIIGYQYQEEFLFGPEIGINRAFQYGEFSDETKVYIESHQLAFEHCFTRFYQLLKHLNLTDSTVLQYSPRIIQAFLGGFWDHYVAKLGKIYGIRPYFILLGTYANWISIICQSIPIKHSLLSLLILISQFHWISFKATNRISDLTTCLICANLLCAVDLKVLFPLLFLWFHEFAEVKRFKSVALFAIGILGMVAYHAKMEDQPIDIIMKHFEFTPAVSLILVGIPTAMLGWTILLILGIVQMKKLEQAGNIFKPTLAYLCYYNLKKNHDIKDLLLILPFLIVMGAFAAQSLLKKSKNSQNFAKLLLAVAIFSNLLYFQMTNFYQNSAAFKAMSYLQGADMSKLQVITYCHTTPYYLSLQRKVEIGYPACQVDLSDPLYYIQNRIGEGPKPSHLIVQSFLINTDVGEFLKDSGYYYKADFSNSFYTMTDWEDYFNDKLLIFEYHS